VPDTNGHATQMDTRVLSACVGHAKFWVIEGSYIS